MSGIYYVSYANTTTDEASPGYYFVDRKADELRGPYMTHDAAREAQSPGCLADEADHFHQHRKDEKVSGCDEQLQGDDW